MNLPNRDLKLMIVDDHAGVRTMIRQLAAAPGDTVCECASGDEAVRLATDFQPDCVTMDLRMPGMCTFDAVRAIRAALPSARIVVVTSHDEALLRHAATEAGVADYLVKDDLSDLRKVLTHRPHSPANESPAASHPPELPPDNGVDIGSVVDEIWHACFPEAQRERVQFKTEPFPQVQGNRARLRIVFENLLANAVKFSAHRAHPLIEIGCAVFREKSVFFVRDNGTGFDMNHAERLFQPSNHLRPSKQTDRGLALVRRIIEEHGGRMWVEAGEDRGATFYFTLPRKPEEPLQTADTGTPPRIEQGHAA